MENHINYKSKPLTVRDHEFGVVDGVEDEVRVHEGDDGVAEAVERVQKRSK